MLCGFGDNGIMLYRIQHRGYKVCRYLPFGTPDFEARGK
jgi:hypothetical protein